MSTGKVQKLSVVSLGLAVGVLWGLAMFIMGVSAMFTGWGGEMTHMMASLYIGADTTWLGSVIGALWGFLDGFIGGALIAWLYNKFSFYCG